MKKFALLLMLLSVPAMAESIVQAVTIANKDWVDALEIDGVTTPVTVHPSDCAAYGGNPEVLRIGSYQIARVNAYHQKQCGVAGVFGLVPVLIEGGYARITTVAAYKHGATIDIVEIPALEYPTPNRHMTMAGLVDGYGLIPRAENDGVRTTSVAIFPLTPTAITITVVAPTSGVVAQEVVKISGPTLYQLTTQFAFGSVTLQGGDRTNPGVGYVGKDPDGRAPFYAVGFVSDASGGSPAVRVVEVFQGVTAP